MCKVGLWRENTNIPFLYITFQFVHIYCIHFLHRQLSGMSLSRSYMTSRSCPLHWTQTNGCPLSLHLEGELLKEWQDIHHFQNHDNHIIVKYSCITGPQAPPWQSSTCFTAAFFNDNQILKNAYIFPRHYMLGQIFFSTKTKKTNLDTALTQTPPSYKKILCPCCWKKSLKKHWRQGIKYWNLILVFQQLSEKTHFLLWIHWKALQLISVISLLVKSDPAKNWILVLINIQVKQTNWPLFWSLALKSCSIKAQNRSAEVKPVILFGWFPSHLSYHMFTDWPHVAKVVST